MARLRTPPVFVLLAVACCCALLAGCGDDPAPAPEGADGSQAEGSADWSEHAGGDLAPAPDATQAGSPEALLARLRARVAAGRGMGDAEYERDVRDVAEVLWPADGTPAERVGAQVHVQLAAVASQVGGWLAEGEEARAARAKSNAVDLEIHQAFLDVSAKGPDAYRTWCEEAGAGLLKKLADARRARFFPPR